MIAAVSIRIDEASLAWVKEITRCLLLLGELFPCPVELAQLIDRLPDRAAAFNTKTLPAARAGEHVLALEPCQALRDLVAAMRAREGAGEFVAELRHDVASDDGTTIMPLSEGGADSEYSAFYRRQMAEIARVFSGGTPDKGRPS